MTIDSNLFEERIALLSDESDREFFYTWACDIIACMPEDRVDYMSWDHMLEMLQEKIDGNY